MPEMEDPESIFAAPALEPDDDPPAEPTDLVSAPVLEAADAALARRRADVDAKQERVAKILEDMQCEGAILLAPAHVAWFTGGMNVRGLIADGERPGVYTNGRQRWLLCSNTDTQRLFDEELDGLGFQVKEWAWYGGRATLLAELASGKKLATDRPFPNLPLIVDRLRPEVRILSAFEQEQYAEIGRLVGHAVEATARTLSRGESEAEVAGQIAHRLVRYGAEPAAVTVTADARTGRFRRAGYTGVAIDRACVLQATAHRDGLFATAARTVSFGPPDADFRSAFDAAIKLSAAYRSRAVPGETVGTAGAVGRQLLANGPFEYEWRHSVPGYGAGRFAAEELRRMAQDEKFAAGWAMVWQARVGPAAVVDTVLVGDPGATCVTPPDGWPFKRVRVQGVAHDIPDVLVRED